MQFAYVQEHGIHISLLEVADDLDAVRIYSVPLSRTNPRLGCRPAFCLATVPSFLSTCGQATA
eukprot:3043059-Pleurochrysis_carterae.AAC.1